MPSQSRCRKNTCCHWKITSTPATSSTHRARPAVSLLLTGELDALAGAGPFRDRSPRGPDAGQGLVQTIDQL